MVATKVVWSQRPLINKRTKKSKLLRTQQMIEALRIKIDACLRPFARLLLAFFLKNQRYTLDILIRKISLDPIGLHGQGAIVGV